MCSDVFLDRIQTQEEIHMLQQEVFGVREKLSLEEFSEIVEKVTSEMFLAVSTHTRALLIYPTVDCDLASVVAALQRELLPLQEELLEIHQPEWWP